VFDRYNIVSEADLKDAAVKLNSYLEEKQAGVSKSLVKEPSEAAPAPAGNPRNLLH
jgi:hypothetical protein